MTNTTLINKANVERLTSCAIDSERFLTGQAFIDMKYMAEGTPIFIYQGGVMDRPATPAKVVSRFAKL
jgi:hypothetical protein